MNEEMQEREVIYHYLETPEAEMAVDGELTVLNTFLPVSEEPTRPMTMAMPAGF